ncbi:MAG: chemotaxis protein CheW [Actinobacteria bacterium]|nr:chemotaxis protein CheW [Actinomycetota bacterium]
MAKESEFALEGEIQLVAFKVGGEEFGVDVKKVEGVISLVDITRLPRAPEFVEGIINLRGQIIAVIDLATRLRIPESQQTAGSRIVVVEVEDIKVGLIVDSPEVINITKGDIEPSPTIGMGDIESSFIRGVAKIEDRLLILLDVDRVLSEGEKVDLGEIDALETEIELGPEEGQ